MYIYVICIYLFSVYDYSNGFLGIWYLTPLSTICHWILEMFPLHFITNVNNLWILLDVFTKTIMTVLLSHWWYKYIVTVCLASVLHWTICIRSTYVSCIRIIPVILNWVFCLHTLILPQHLILSPIFSGVRVPRSLFLFLSFFHWPVYCLSFSDLLASDYTIGMLKLFSNNSFRSVCVCVLLILLCKNINYRILVACMMITRFWFIVLSCRLLIISSPCRHFRTF